MHFFAAIARANNAFVKQKRRQRQTNNNTAGDVYMCLWQYIENLRYELSISTAVAQALPASNIVAKRSNIIAQLGSLTPEIPIVYRI